MKNELGGALGVDVQVAVFAADGAVAIHHRMALEGAGEEDGVFDGAAVAVGWVPCFGWGVGGGGGRRSRWGGHG